MECCLHGPWAPFCSDMHCFLVRRLVPSNLLQMQATWGSRAGKGWSSSKRLLWGAAISSATSWLHCLNSASCDNWKSWVSKTCLQYQGSWSEEWYSAYGTAGSCLLQAVAHKADVHDVLMPICLFWGISDSNLGDCMHLAGKGKAAGRLHCSLAIFKLSF